METLDVLVSLARSLRGRGPLRLRKEDFVGAFKTLPLALAALCMAVAVWGEAAEEGWALQLWCCPFGAVASVYAWERFGSAIQVCVRMRGAASAGLCARRRLQGILGRLFYAPTGRFVDDLFSVEPEGDPASGSLGGAAGASRVTRFVIETLLGWDLDAEKRMASAVSANILGVSVSMVDEPAGSCRSALAIFGRARSAARRAGTSDDFQHTPGKSG